MATDKKIAAVVAMLCEAFNRKPSAATYKVYEIALAGVSDELLDSAASTAIASNADFMPTPGRLRELALTGGIGYESRAERAWLEFDRAVLGHGADHSVTFADGLINAACRLIGDWKFCCGRAGDDYEIWLRKQFLETYQRLCVDGTNEDLRLPLVGNLERENMLRFGPAQMAEYQKAHPRENCGQVVLIGTKQPVLFPPSKPTPLRVESRPKDVPRIELQRAT